MVSARIVAKWRGHCGQCGRTVVAGESCQFVIETRELVCDRCLVHPAKRRRRALYSYARTALREVPESERERVLREEFKGIDAATVQEVLACASG